MSVPPNQPCDQPGKHSGDPSEADAPPIRIKVCGVRDAEGARACLEAGVDLVGFNFVPTSRRRVSLEQALALTPLLGRIARVGVFCNQPLEQVLELARVLALEAVQLHGQEPPAYCREVTAAFPVIKAMAVDEAFSPDQLEPYVPWVRAFLLDAPTAGSGRPFDWAKLAGIEPALKAALKAALKVLPGAEPGEGKKGPERLEGARASWFLAGGLTSENVKQALERVRPDGVDTASGVEVDGRQDRARILEFCRQVRLRS